MKIPPARHPFHCWIHLGAGQKTDGQRVKNSGKPQKCHLGKKTYPVLRQESSLLSLLATIVTPMLYLVVFLEVFVTFAGIKRVKAGPYERNRARTPRFYPRE